MNMNFTEKTKGLEDMFLSIIKVLLDLFDDKKMFLSKLNFTELYVTDTDNHTNSNIFCEKNGYGISMKINMEDSLYRICMQFSHELGHLICMPLSINPFGSFNRTDKSFAITTLTRINKNVTYGATFEEVFCNYVACLVIEALDIEVEQQDSLYFQSIKRSCIVVENIISAFQIDPCEKWDETIDKDIPCNALLFGIANGDISYAIYLYDKEMGEGEWMKIMQTIYWYCYAFNYSEKESISCYIAQKMLDFKRKFVRKIKVVA